MNFGGDRFRAEASPIPSERCLMEGAAKLAALINERILRNRRRTAYTEPLLGVHHQSPCDIGAQAVGSVLEPLQRGIDGQDLLRAFAAHRHENIVVLDLYRTVLAVCVERDRQMAVRRRMRSCFKSSIAALVV